MWPCSVPCGSALPRIVPTERSRRPVCKQAVSTCHGKGWLPAGWTNLRLRSQDAYPAIAVLRVPAHASLGDRRAARHALERIGPTAALQTAALPLAANPWAHPIRHPAIYSLPYGSAPTSRSRRTPHVRAVLCLHVAWAECRQPAATARGVDTTSRACQARAPNQMVIFYANWPPALSCMGQARHGRPCAAAGDVAC